jgi:PBSX family phage terminase large subunit
MKAEIPVNRKPYEWLQAHKKRIALLYGGASSSKSHTVAQFLVYERFCKLKGIGILVVRKTRPAVKTSCWRLLERYLGKAKVQYKPNLADLTIALPERGNFILCDGLDNIGKKKSIEGINYIWVAEMAGLSSDTRITQREFHLLDTICRNTPVAGCINQIYGTFNPVDPVGNEWIENLTKRGDTEDMSILHLNHNENPFLSVAEHETIERLADKDPEYDKIYRKGEWATPSFIIYSNWDVVEQMPEKFDDRMWGLDFGYSGNPAALVEQRWCGPDDVYERERIYQTNLTNPELIAKMKMIITEPTDEIVADCAEPKSIQEMRNAGFNIHPCQKGPDSVNFGINKVQSVRTHITADSLNMQKEKRGYKWKQDKDERQLDKPVKFMDHLMDAERYAIARKKGGIRAGVAIAEDEEPEWDDEDMWESW